MILFDEPSFRNSAKIWEHRKQKRYSKGKKKIWV